LAPCVEASIVKLDIVENSGPDNLRDTLKSQLRRISEVSIAVAFVTQAGLDEIVQALRQVAASGSVRLLTGLYQKVTEPQALTTLLRIQEETRGRFSVRLSREPQFHRKLYLLNSRTHSTAILGSSNLTREGLRSGGELNLIVRLPKGSLPVKKLSQAFEDDWEHRAVPLTAEQLVEYEKARPEAPKRESYTKGQLAKILGAPPSHRQATEAHQDKDFWRECITGVVKKRTERVISETTNWDDKGYWWFSPGGPHPFKIGDRIFLFDFPDRRIRLVEVKDVAHTKVATPDGRHFVAYRPLFRLTRRFSRKLWAALEGEGIHPKNARGRRKVGSEKAKRLRVLIRPVKR
jgi:HKD family nuclease